MSEKKKVKEVLGIKEVEVKPLKDWHICHPPKYDIYLKEGETVTVPELFIQNLVTEGVIPKK